MGLHDNSPRNGNFLSIKHHAICKELKPAPQTEEEIAQAIADGFHEKTVQNPSDVRPDGTIGTVQKWLRLYGSLDGMITGLEWYDRTHDGVRYMGLKMKIKDASETYILDLGFGSKGYDVFTRVMEDIDYTQPIEISVWQDKKKKNASAVLFRQNGDAIKWRYTREWNSNIVRALGAIKGYEETAVRLFEELEAGALTQETAAAVNKAGFVVAPPPVHNPLAKPAWNFDAQRAFLWQRLNDVVIPRVLELNPAFDDPQPEYSGADPDEATSFDPAVLEATAPAAAPQEYTGPPTQRAAAAPADAPWMPPGVSPDPVDEAF